MENLIALQIEQEVRINMGSERCPAWKRGFVKRILKETISINIQLPTQGMIIEKPLSEIGKTIKTFES